MAKDRYPQAYEEEQVSSQKQSNSSAKSGEYSEYIRRIAEQASGEMEQQSQMTRPPDKKGGIGFALFFVVLAVVLMVGSSFVPGINAVSQWMLGGFGFVLMAVGVTALVYTHLMVVADADWAFVRIGGGSKVVMNGRAFVIPMIHRIKWVPLRTIKLIVVRLGNNSLLTRDNLLADAVTEFFMKVEKDEKAILQAATSLGDDLLNPKKVLALLSPKFVDALRNVARNSDLDGLMSKRADFSKAVREILIQNLPHNGLTLEDVTFSHLDQASEGAMDPINNVFHAQGAKRIAEIVQTALTEKTRIENDQRVARVNLNAAAEQAIKERDVQKETFLFQQDVARTQAEQTRTLEQARIVAETSAQQAAIEADNKATAQGIQAEKERQTKEAQIAAQRAVELANVAKTQAVQVASVQQEQEVQTAQIAKDKAVQIASVEREKAVQTATVARNQAVEVAKREQEITIADAEKRRAEAEAAQLVAQAEREKADQAVITVQKEAEAERQKKVTVISKQAEAERTRIEQETGVNLEAYRTTKLADAEQAAAEKKAAAVRIQAEASRDAKALEAEGDQVVQLVPVQVERERVNVQAAEVEVLRTKLAAQDEHQAAAIELQVKLAEIAANKEVRIEAARALGNAFSKANMTIWGDRSTVDQISHMFVNGQAFGHMISGAVQTIPPDVQEFVKDGVSGVATIVSGALKRLTGQEVSADIVEKHLRDEASARVNGKTS